jgi:hypothetical protein
MAAIRKRTWDSRAGKKSAWVLTYTDANRKRRMETFSLLENAEARKQEIINNNIPTKWQWDNIQALIKTMMNDPDTDPRVTALAVAVTAINTLWKIQND